MAVKSHPYQSILAYSADAMSWTNLTDVKMITPPPWERNESPTGHLESTSMTDESQGGKVVPGDLEFVAHYHQTQFDALKTIFDLTGSSGVYYWRISAPALSGQTTPARLQGQGWIKTLAVGEMNWDSDDPIEAPGTIKCTGPWTYTPGS